MTHHPLAPGPVAAWPESLPPISAGDLMREWSRLIGENEALRERLRGYLHPGCTPESSCGACEDLRAYVGQPPPGPGR